MGCVKTVGSHKQNYKIEKSKTKKGGRMETNKKKWKVKKMKQSMESIGSCICLRTGLWHREVLEELKTKSGFLCVASASPMLGFV